MNKTANELAKLCHISQWNPSEKQIALIEQELLAIINNGEVINRARCQKVVAKHCPNTIFMLLDSVDNSDLNTLLMLAIKK